MKFLFPLLFFTIYAGFMQIWAIFGYGISYYEITFFLIYFLFIWNIILKNIEIKYSINIISLVFILFFISILFSVINPILTTYNEQMIQALKSTFHLIFLIFFVFICLFYPLDSKIWYNCLKIWLVISIPINLFGIYQIFARLYNLPLAWIDYSQIIIVGKFIDDNPFNQLSLRFGNFFRATSYFSEPSALASFNLYIIVLSFIPSIKKMKLFVKYELLNRFIFILSLITLFFCFSLTGLTGLAFIIIGIFLIDRKYLKKSFLKYVLLTSIIIFILNILAEDLFDVNLLSLFNKRVTSLSSVLNQEGVETVDGESVFSRYDNNKISIDVWLKNPIIGCGLGQFQFQSDEFSYNDNSFMAVLTEMGVVGVLSYLLIFYSLFYYSIKLNKTSKQNINNSEYDILLSNIIFYFMIIQFLINFITANNFIAVYSWLPMGFVASVITNLNNKNNLNLKTFKFRNSA